MTQADVAEQIGVKQATIDKIEHNRSQRSRFLPAVFRVLGLPVDEAIEIAQGPLKILPRSELVGDTDLPVYASTEGGEGQIIITTDIVDRVRRPTPLLHVREGYGVLITGESMVPAFRPGDIALVHPHMPPRVDDAVILVSREQDRSTIKEFRGVTEKLWRLRRYRPKEEDFTLARAEWPTAHTVVGRYTRR